MNTLLLPKLKVLLGLYGIQFFTFTIRSVLETFKVSWRKTFKLVKSALSWEKKKSGQIQYYFPHSYEEGLNIIVNITFI